MFCKTSVVASWFLLELGLNTHADSLLGAEIEFPLAGPLLCNLLGVQLARCVKVCLSAPGWMELIKVGTGVTYTLIPQHNSDNLKRFERASRCYITNAGRPVPPGQINPSVVLSFSLSLFRSDNKRRAAAFSNPFFFKTNSSVGRFWFFRSHHCSALSYTPRALSPLHNQHDIVGKWLL